jgi:hypothetical protein
MNALNRSKPRMAPIAAPTMTIAVILETPFPRGQTTNVGEEDIVPAPHGLALAESAEIAA